MAFNLTGEEFEAIKQAFLSVDKDGNGVITEKELVDAALEQIEDLKYKWYKFSEQFVPDNYKSKYAHNNDKRTLIENWYSDCIKIGLLPEEFMMSPANQETKRTKSFHKQRKEEWKQRQSARSKIKIEEKERKEDNKPHFFKRTK